MAGRVARNGRSAVTGTGTAGTPAVPGPSGVRSYRSFWATHADSSERAAASRDADGEVAPLVTRA